MMTLWPKISLLVSNISIKYKIFVSYFMILVMTLLIVVSANAVLTARETKEKTLFTASQSILQTASFIEFKITSTKNMMDMIALNENLQSILYRPAEEYAADFGLRGLDTLQLKKLFFTTKSNPDITEIKLYLERDHSIVYQSHVSTFPTSYVDETWYKTLQASTNKVNWFTEKELPNEQLPPTLVALKKIPSKNNLNQSIGILRFDLSRQLLIDLIDQGLSTPSSTALLISPDSTIALSSNLKLSEKDQTDITAYALKHSTPIDTWQDFQLSKGHVLVCIKEINHTDWRLITLLPQVDIISAQNHSRNQIILVFLIVIPFTFPVAYVVSASITKRIKLLIAQISEVDTAKFDQKINPSSKDEVGILTKNFNYMLVKISMLLDEKYELGQEMKSIELKALQAQINPHFLYNTLDQIYWLGVRYNIQEVSDIVLALSKFYKLSLSKGKSEVPLRSELEHIQAYVNIQNHRFENSIQLNIDVSEDALDVIMPKISLQPIVENAILHGILESEEETGTIYIRTRQNDTDLWIDIRDDGAGMTQEKTNELLLTDTADESLNGYGLKNIDSRFKLLYGPDYGLSFTSAVGAGTTVTIHMPNGKVKNE